MAAIAGRTCKDRVSKAMHGSICAWRVLSRNVPLFVKSGVRGKPPTPPQAEIDKPVLLRPYGFAFILAQEATQGEFGRKNERVA